MKRHSGSLLANRVEWSLDTDNRNRLQFSAYKMETVVDDPALANDSHTRPDGETTLFAVDLNHLHVSLTFGSYSSDPVWGIYAEVWVPRWIQRRGQW